MPPPGVRNRRQSPRSAVRPAGAGRPGRPTPPGPRGRRRAPGRRLPARRRSPRGKGADDDAAQRLQHRGPAHEGDRHQRHAAPGEPVGQQRARMAREHDVVGAAGADQGEEEDHGPHLEARQRGEQGQRTRDDGGAAEDEPLARVQPSLDRAQHQVGGDQRDRHHQQRVARLHRCEPVPVGKVGAAPEPQHGDDHRIGGKPHQRERGEARRRQRRAHPAQALAQPFGRCRAGCVG